MKVIMRLYRQHDLDLIYLYASKKFSLQQEIKKALRAYVHNEPYSINYPVSATQNHNVTLPKHAQFHIVLDEATDADVISWILSISRGYRNSAIKNLTRGYLSSPSLHPYFDEAHLTFKPEFAKDTQSPEGDITASRQLGVERGRRNIEDDVLMVPTPPENPNVTMKESDDILHTNTEASTDDWFTAFDAMIN